MMQILSRAVFVIGNSISQISSANIDLCGQVTKQLYEKVNKGK